MMTEEPPVVRCQVSIAVEYQCPRLEKPLGEPERSAGSEECLGFDRVIDMHTQTIAAAEALADLGGSVADAKYEAPQSLVAEQRDLNFEERSIAHGGEGFGPIGNDSAQPGPQSAGEDHDRIVFL
jgi:hypothetical protein